MNKQVKAIENNKHLMWKTRKKKTMGEGESSL